MAAEFSAVSTKGEGSGKKAITLKVFFGMSKGFYVVLCALMPAGYVVYPMSRMFDVVSLVSPDDVCCRSGYLAIAKLVKHH
tara:strand:- start:677 stop:919 length:243 start_codon:yes stop_codon:yes gene_type:complete